MIQTLSSGTILSPGTGMGSLRCFHGMRVGGIFFKSSYKVSFRRSFWLEDILNHKSCCYCDGQDVTNFTKAKFSLGM